MQDSIKIVAIRAGSGVAVALLVLSGVLATAQYFGFNVSPLAFLITLFAAAFIGSIALAAANIDASAAREELTEAASVAYQISQGSFFDEGDDSDLHDSFRKISEYLREKALLAERVASGDAMARVDLRSDADKFGLAFQRMIDRLRPAIETINSQEQLQDSVIKLLGEVSHVAGGDLTVQAEVSPELTGEIAVAFNSMTRNLRTLIKQVKTVTLQVGASTNAINETTEQLARGSSAQAGQISRTTLSIANMAAQIQEVSVNASASAEVAANSLTNARYGMRAAKDNIAAMEAIRQQVQDTAKRIKRLGERAQEIGQITALIDDLSDRTSLLALNASLQAAAAGVPGNGFALVAEEVERLAARSISLTQQISSLSHAINSETKEVVGSMENTIREVVNGTKMADRAGRSLVEIEETSTQLADLLRSISQSTQFQAKGSEEISNSMTGIAEVTEIVRNGAARAADSVRLLVDLSDELRASVSPFKLPAELSEHQVPAERAGGIFVN